MNQILPLAKFRTVQSYVYLHDALTGRVIASQPTYSFRSIYGRWSWIVRQIVAEYDCEPDQVGSVDTDDRFDNITVNGKIVGWMEQN